MNLIELKKITDYYNITFDAITKEINSTNQNDYRLNLILDNKYVVRINDTKAITEERLAGIERLICRYNSIGITALYRKKARNDKQPKATTGC